MKTWRGLLCLWMGLFSAVGQTAQTEFPSLTFEEKRSDLEQLVSLIKSGYGPLQYKKQVLGIDVDRLKDEYIERIKSSKTNGEFYYLLVQFVAEFQDSHFRALLPTDFRAYLPLSTDRVEGKALIDTVDRQLLPAEQFPFSRGDEIVAVDGVPVAQVLDRLEKYVSAGFEGTRRRIATMLIASRSARILPVPWRKVTLSIRRANALIAEDVKLGWRYQGEPLDESKMKSHSGFQLHREKSRNYDLLSLNDYWSDLDQPHGERGYMCSGTTRIAIPANATVILMSPFVAYYHPTPQGNIGYLRIPHYFPQNEVTGEFEYELRFAQYEYAVSILEKNTMGLIIDQDHNCGGSVEFTHKMLSLFVEENVPPLQFQLRANKQEYVDYLSWVKQLDPHTVDYENNKKVLDSIRTSWEAGNFLTPKTPIYGDREVHPHTIRYTKPIVMLIDELAGSGGDAFPALMQGYGRAKLLGTRTMGAGGHVTDEEPLYNSQLNLRLTKSLFFRPDGIPVENNGAKPDVPYAITRDDFTNGYRGYQAFYIKKLLEQIQRSQTGLW